MVATLYCDECRIALCKNPGAMFMGDEAQKIGNEHDEKVHGGKGFAYSLFKD